MSNAALSSSSTNGEIQPQSDDKVICHSNAGSKMAPVYMASHLLLSPTFSFLSCHWLFICFLTSLNQVETLTYDCQSLLDIRSCCMVVSEINIGKFVDITYRTIIQDILIFFVDGRLTSSLESVGEDAGNKE